MLVLVGMMMRMLMVVVIMMTGHSQNSFQHIRVHRQSTHMDYSAEHFSLWKISTLRNYRDDLYWLEDNRLIKTANKRMISARGALCLSRRLKPHKIEPHSHAID